MHADAHRLANAHDGNDTDAYTDAHPFAGPIRIAHASGDGSRAPSHLDARTRHHRYGHWDGRAVPTPGDGHPQRDAGTSDRNDHC